MSTRWLTTPPNPPTPPTSPTVDRFWSPFSSSGLLFSVLLPICRGKMATGLPTAVTDCTLCVCFLHLYCHERIPARRNRYSAAINPTGRRPARLARGLQPTRTASSLRYTHKYRWCETRPDPLSLLGWTQSAF